MNDNPEFQPEDTWPDGSTQAPKRKRIGSSNSKLLRVLLGSLLVVVFAGGVLYFIARQSTGSHPNPPDLKMAAFEQKISSLEEQLKDLQARLGTMGQDPALLQRLEALGQRVEALEKRTPSATDTKIKPVPPRPTVTIHKRYHTVHKGETLFRISQKYGIPVEKLRKLNNLSPDKPVLTGQKLLLSQER